MASIQLLLCSSLEFGLWFRIASLHHGNNQTYYLELNICLWFSFSRWNWCTWSADSQYSVKIHEFWQMDTSVKLSTPLWKYRASPHPRKYPCVPSQSVPPCNPLPERQPLFSLLSSWINFTCSWISNKCITCLIFVPGSVTQYSIFEIGCRYQYLFFFIAV